MIDLFYFMKSLYFSFNFRVWPLKPLKLIVSVCILNAVHYF